MSDTMVYRRTMAGQTAAREHPAELDVRERTLLAQIDGKRKVSDIKIRMAVLMDVDAVIASLLRRGLIEPDPALAPKVTISPVAAAAPVADVSVLRRTLIRAIHDALGPEGEQMELRLEGAKTIETLREVAERASSLIEAMRGRATAEKFRALYH